MKGLRSHWVGGSQWTTLENVKQNVYTCMVFRMAEKPSECVYNIVYGVNVTQLYFGRGEILCILNLTFMPRFISLNLFYSTHKDNSAWSFVCRICGYVVFSPLFSCLSKPGTVQIRQFPLTYQIFNFVTQIKNHHLGISPKVGIVQGWRLECWITRIILYVWCVGLALCSHH